MVLRIICAAGSVASSSTSKASSSGTVTPLRQTPAPGQVPSYRYRAGPEEHVMPFRSQMKPDPKLEHVMPLRSQIKSYPKLEHVMPLKSQIKSYPKLEHVVPYRNSKTPAPLAGPGGSAPK